MAKAKPKEDTKTEIKILKRVQLKSVLKMELVKFENLKNKVEELKKECTLYFEVIDNSNSSKISYTKLLFTDNYVVKTLKI